MYGFQQQQTQQKQAGINVPASSSQYAGVNSRPPNQRRGDYGAYVEPQFFASQKRGFPELSINEDGDEMIISGSGSNGHGGKGYKHGRYDTKN
jgi:hypothetical protein